MSHRIKVISFDLDDTLWPCLPVIRHAENTLFEWLSENVPAITARYSIDQLHEKRKQHLLENPALAHDLSECRRQSFLQLAEELALGDDWVETAFQVFYDARQKVTLYDDVAPALDELGRDFELVSLTNGNADASRTGIDRWFRLSLNSAMVGKQKSHPDIYQQVQREFNIEPGQMMHIGDDPLHDIRGAQLAGVTAVWINRDGQHWQQSEFSPDATIAGLHQVSEILNHFRDIE